MTDATSVDGLCRPSSETGALGAVDAELLGLWDEWKSIRSAIAMTDDDAEAMTMYELLTPIEQHIMQTPAGGPAGMACKLSIAIAYGDATSLEEMSGFGIAEAMMVSAFRDALAASAVSRPLHPFS